eukprot:GDKH01021476.1.p1 GENE.GDKH01021476.1~~GDKH01021476.1.p1  ORF type:complete len:267 (-),score=27.77 GDKH01021476.1:196-996(-)
MYYISGHFGDSEVAKEPFVSDHIPEWTGPANYEAMYFAKLQVTAKSSAPLASMPALSCAANPAEKYSHDFSEEKRVMRRLTELATDREKQKQARADVLAAKDAAVAAGDASRRKAAIPTQREISPRTQERNRKVQEVKEITSATEEVCRTLLEANSWDKNAAIRKFFDQNDQRRRSGGGGPPQQTPTSSREIMIELKFPNNQPFPIPFPENKTLRDLHDLAEVMMPEPRRAFTMFYLGGALEQRDFGKPLRDLHFGNTATIEIRPN